MQRGSRLLPVFALGAIACAVAAGARAAAPLSANELEALAQEVSAAETAFAKSMADRRIDRFAEFIAEDAVFRGAALHIGRATVVETWRPFFAAAQAPFSWAPDVVTVAADGRSALSTGPVRDAQGKVSSRFMTLWTRSADGRWRVRVDQGVEACPCASPSAAAPATK
jgi:ketosteroid isomerase-like protein